MSAIPQEAPESGTIIRSSLRNRRPPNLVTIPPEMRLHIYAYLFGERTAVMTKRSDIGNICRRRVRVARIDEDVLSRTNRSSQVLRVCRKIFYEALPVLYSSTRFYLHSGAHLGSLSRHIDCNSVRSILLRLHFRMHDRIEDADSAEAALRPLCMDGLILPSLTSLQIKVNPIKSKDSLTARTEAQNKEMQVAALSKILQIQGSRKQLTSLFVTEPQTGDVIGFRLATAGAVIHDGVGAPIRGRGIPQLTSCRREFGITHRLFRYRRV